MGLKLYDKSRALLGHWPMNEGTGTSVRDIVHGRNGHLVNIPWQGVEIPEGSLHFNGKDSYVHLGNLGEFGKHVGNCTVVWPSLCFALLHRPCSSAAPRRKLSHGVAQRPDRDSPVFFHVPMEL